MDQQLVIPQLQMKQAQEQSHYQILALYRFVAPKLQNSQLASLQVEIERTCRAHHARGCILIAPEGINGTISYPMHGEHDVLLQFFEQAFPGLKTRLSAHRCHVFARLKVKVKAEIVTMAGRQVDPTEQSGEYVKPTEWNNLLKDPDCVVIDARNDFEIYVGAFPNAINPATTHFSEFPKWFETAVTKQPKRIGMYCTGGIRCEKSTAIAKLCFPNTPVYHLEGGILAYLDTLPASESMFHGECYVFDQRVAVTHGLAPSSSYTSCHACRHPLSLNDRQNADYRQGLSCSFCVSTITERQRQRFEERQHQVELAQENGVLHMHDPKEEQIFT